VYFVPLSLSVFAARANFSSSSSFSFSFSEAGKFEDEDEDEDDWVAASAALGISWFEFLSFFGENLGRTKTVD
jgi:hypothetical protein